MSEFTRDQRFEYHLDTNKRSAHRRCETLAELLDILVEEESDMREGKTEEIVRQWLEDRKG